MDHLKRSGRSSVWRLSQRKGLSFHLPSHAFITSLVGIDVGVHSLEFDACRALLNELLDKFLANMAQPAVSKVQAYLSVGSVHIIEIQSLKMVKLPRLADRY